MVREYKLRIGSRAQVMHGTAKMTGGGLTKRQLKYNKNGKIVSRKASRVAKKANRHVKAGYVTRKGVFGVVRRGGATTSNSITPPVFKTHKGKYVVGVKVQFSRKRNTGVIDNRTVMENHTFGYLTRSTSIFPRVVLRIEKLTDFYINSLISKFNKHCKGTITCKSKKKKNSDTYIKYTFDNINVFKQKCKDINKTLDGGIQIVIITNNNLDRNKYNTENNTQKALITRADAKKRAERAEKEEEIRKLIATKYTNMNNKKKNKIIAYGIDQLNRGVSLNDIINTIKSNANGRSNTFSLHYLNKTNSSGYITHPSFKPALNNVRNVNTTKNTTPLYHPEELQSIGQFKNLQTH